MAFQVLVADDSVTMRRAVQISLAREDCTVITATSGAEALAQARAQKLDVCIIDFNLPDMDGYALCQALKQDASTGAPAIVVLTNKSGTYDEQRAKAAGADTSLAKPFETPALVDRVASVRAAKRATPSASTIAPPAPRPVAAPTVITLGDDLPAPPPPTPPPQPVFQPVFTASIPSAPTMARAARALQPNAVPPNAPSTAGATLRSMHTKPARLRMGRSAQSSTLKPSDGGSAS